MGTADGPVVQALVIDDSRAMRSILRRVLVELGFEVSEAANGQEALTHVVEHGAPDVALVDWNMPVMDGLQFVVELRSRREFRGVTLMMVTTESEHAQMVRALAAGAHEYLVKPFTPDAIAAKLALLGLVAA
ncbi:response regulator [Nocardioides pocheonensis]|uniref:response regulator n=1 Tax=Nocardioides pocheonensis TaxID=661485 RepID=UPI002482191F|nr:response regulator [Nocardioides pocheonensis]